MICTGCMQLDTKVILLDIDETCTRCQTAVEDSVLLFENVYYSKYDLANKELTIKYNKSKFSEAKFFDFLIAKHFVDTSNVNSDTLEVVLLECCIKMESNNPNSSE